LVIKNGTLKNGMFVLSGTSCAPTRIMEDFLGKPIKEASFSSPINIVGWDKMPKVGEAFTSYGKKKELEKILKDIKEEKVIPVVEEEDERKVVPLIIKADTLGSIEAIQGEIEKIKDERISIKIIDNGTGNISENDIKVAGGSKETIVLGFNVKTDRGVENLADRMDVEIQTFGIIYKLTEWLNEEVKKRRPKIKDDEVRGKAKILKIFSKTKNKQVLGGEVKEGMIGLNDKVKILRRDEQIGEGVIVELQVAKTSAKEVREGTQFGAKIQSSVEIAERDKIEAFVTVEK
jgi:translation initiation factor IF-2